MLTQLSIHNVVLIDRLDVEFGAGLCALTGETGAGKSILLESLGLALGARAETRLVRAGQAQAQVSAVFEVSADNPLYKVLVEAGVVVEPGEGVIVRRVVGADGRSKAFINDQAVSAGLLREIGGYLGEIHGQFETQGLLNSSTHLSLLDEYAGVERAAIAARWQGWQEAREKLEEMRSSAETARAEEEYLRGALEDLDALEPKAGEEDELAGLRERLMNREQVLEALSAAYHALSGEHDPVRAAQGAIDRAASKIGGAAEEILAALGRANAEIQEGLSLIQSLSADLEEAEHDLQSIDERLFALRGQARKFSCDVDDLPAKREELAERLNMIEHGDDLLIAQTKKVEAARSEYIKLAQEIHAERVSAAQRLDALVAKELPPLKMDKARFVSQVSEREENGWGPSGLSDVQFLVATNPGAAPGPIGKIASGGEMARFMLALKVVMAEVASVSCMIFDEVDAGIGGATADAVGERLARLADSSDQGGRQVLVVTHSPQVAARADHHYIVQKGGADTVTTTLTALNTQEERSEEIARMLAGAEITVEARAAAERLLKVG